MEMNSRTIPVPSLARAVRRRAFTMIELLVVILIIAILLALLVPAIVGAIRTVRNAQVSTDIQTLGTALHQFKNTFGDFPPSRMYLNESGVYPVNNTTHIAQVGTDITVGILAQRSLRYLQKFWPRAQFSSDVNTVLYPNNTIGWHDFNGNGQFDVGPAPNGGYIIHGHQCLVFFLGGIPYNPGGTTGIGMTGFGKNPANPFTNNVPNNTAPGSLVYRGVTPSSSTPLFEFRSNRLAYDPNDQFASGIPAYVDAIGAQASTPGSPINFYAYFSSYGGAYDPNDVNFAEVDQHGNLLGLSTTVGFACIGPGSGGSATNVCTSPPPNPYTASSAVPLTGGTATFQSPNTFQIISSGLDGIYGLGGQWSNQSGAALPFEKNADNSTDPAVREPENDNLSNFSTGKLGS